MNNRILNLSKDDFPCFVLKNKRGDYYNPRTKVMVVRPTLSNNIPFAVELEHDVLNKPMHPSLWIPPDREEDEILVDVSDRHAERFELMPFIRHTIYSNHSCAPAEYMAKTPLAELSRSRDDFTIVHIDKSGREREVGLLYWNDSPSLRISAETCTYIQDAAANYYLFGWNRTLLINNIRRLVLSESKDYMKSDEVSDYEFGEGALDPNFRTLEVYENNNKFLPYVFECEFIATCIYDLYKKFEGNETWFTCSRIPKDLNIKRHLPFLKNRLFVKEVEIIDGFLELSFYHVPSSIIKKLIKY